MWQSVYYSRFLHNCNRSHTRALLYLYRIIRILYMTLFTIMYHNYAPPVGILGNEYLRFGKCYEIV